MGLFDEQIRQRKQSDQEIFEDSIIKMASVVDGRGSLQSIQDERIITKDAIDEILKFYHLKPVNIPDKLKDLDEQLDFALRPHGMMYRRVDLTEEWEKDGYGPLIAYRKEDGMPVALLPKGVSGYKYRDISGNIQSVNKKNAEAFETEAICFYRPLPLKSLGIVDLMLYIKDCISVSDIVVLLVLTLVATLIGMMIPRLTYILTGFVLESKNVSILLGTAIFIVAVSISSHLIEEVNSHAAARIQIKSSNAVEAAVMMRLMSLPAPFFKEYSSGELSSRNQAVNQLCHLLMGNMVTVSITSLTSLLYITQIFKFAPELVSPAIIIILATVLVMLVTTFMQMKISKQQMELSAKENGISFALISGVQKIKLAGAEKRAFAKWAHIYTSSAELMYNPPLFIKLSGVLTTTVSLIGTLVLYYLAVETGVSPSEYIAFNASYGMVMGAFSSLAGIAISVAQIRPILEMAEPILKEEPEIAEGKEILTSISGSIELNNVYFRYNEGMPYVVNGINLKIRSGEYIAIVGKTGCGKSTLMRLLLGFEKPEKGAIYYDGKDMSRIDLRSLRRKIGAVTQDGGLFQGDIYSNIVISAPQLTIDDAWAAAETAGIADDIREMPMGMHTIISEGQGGISGGQKQRLMIARAIAPKPKILMFDEATSALDNKTQKQVAEALDRLRATRIVIAHRLSTIKNCDRILVLDNGQIIEDGKYDELIAKGGYFAELVERQRLDTGEGNAGGNREAMR